MRNRSRFRTQFCFIAPGSLLDRYASHSRTHLVLPQVENVQYIEFYKRKRREGDLIILDNGAYEGVKDWNLLRKGLDRYNPHVAALPDFLLEDGEKTFEEARGFYHLMKDEYPNVKWMYIPQSTPGDIWGFYRWMERGIKEIKPAGVGLPRALVTDIAPEGPKRKLARVDACEWLQVLYPEVNTHALGMANGDLKELEGLFWEGCCSVDSGAPIWRGVYGSKLDNVAERNWWDQHGLPVDFEWNGKIGDQAMSWKDSDVKHNMNLVLKALGQPEIK